MFHLKKESKFWVVRAGRDQKYYDFFRKESVISVGHWDQFLRDNANPNLESFDNFTDLYKAIREIALPDGMDKAQRRNAFTKLTQGQKFFNELKPGDFILTFGNDKVSFGIIESDCKIIPQKVTESLFTPTHRLQRKVKWVVEKEKKKIPSSLSKMISSPPLSVYSANEHADTIISWISPCHQTENTITLSTNINSRNNIGSTQKANLNLTFCHLELISKELDILPAQEILEKIKNRDFFDLISSNLTSSEKAEYMSPGFTWVKIESNDLVKKSIIAAMFLFLLGNKAMAEEEILELENLTGRPNQEWKADIELLANAVSDKHNFSATKASLELDLSKNPKIIIPKPVSNPKNRVR